MLYDKSDLGCSKSCDKKRPPVPGSKTETSDKWTARKTRDMPAFLALGRFIL